LIHHSPPHFIDNHASTNDIYTLSLHDALPILQTPNIDVLAKNGLRFTNYYAGSTVCAPSREALLTGKHTGHTYIRGNFLTNEKRSEEHTSELQSRENLVCRLLLEKKNTNQVEQ